MRSIIIAAALVFAATSAHAQMGVKLDSDPIAPRSLMGNPSLAPLKPAAIALPDCQAGVEALTAMGGVLSCVTLPTGGGGPVNLVVTNGLKLTGNVLSLTTITEDKTAADYTVAATDAVKTLLVAAHTYSLPQAGTAGFGDEWGTCFANQTDATTATITTATSLFTGAPGSPTSTYKLPPKQASCVTSFKGNYLTFMVR